MPVYELSPCIACGGTSGEQLADAEAIRAELELLWEFHDRRLRPGTPPEQLTDRVAFTQDPALRIERCRGCGLVFRNPRERPRALREAYAGEQAEAAVLARLFDTQRDAARAQERRLRDVAGRAGRVLEVGSFVGGFLAAANEAGWSADGLDVNEVAVEFARSRGLRSTLGDIGAYETTGPLDAVAIWNCFDQLDDPRAAARSARGLLADGGTIAVRVPNGGFWAAARAHLRGPLAPAARLVLAHSNLLGFPYRHGFTPGSLRRLLEATGFEVTRTWGDALVPIADRWTRPWAALEERAVKRALRMVARMTPDAAPWFEMYARAA